MHSTEPSRAPANNGSGGSLALWLLTTGLSLSLFPNQNASLAAEPKPQDTVEELRTEGQKASYALGMQIGDHLKGLPAKLDLDLFLKGVRDTVEGRQPSLTPDEARTAQQRFFSQTQAKQGERWKELGRKNEQEGAEFLEANGKKEGVKTTRSGLQYVVLQKGERRKPKKRDRVRVHYRGTLLDGTEFDSSYARGEPATLGVTQVIAGWTEALLMMPVGSKYRLFIPSELAYSNRGAGPKIGPNATLIFDVELLDIEK